MDSFERVGADPSDTHEIRLQKRLVVGIAAMVGVLAVFWGLIYLAFGEPLAASIPFVYAAASAVSTAHFSITRRYAFFRTSQLLLTLMLPFFLMLVLGGFINSSAVILWSLIAPLGAMLMFGRRQSIPWFAAYAALVGIGLIAEPLLRVENNLSTVTIRVFFAMKIVAVSAVMFVVLQYFVGKRDEAHDLLAEEQDRSQTLLLNMLPEEVAELLKTGPRTIASHFDSISVLFADLVGFTPLSQQMKPEQIVDLLNQFFSHFDQLVDEQQVEKIRTIGDSYMVAAGVPTPTPDHALALARVAIGIRDYVMEMPAFNGHRLDFRIGINSGPAVGGVIGTKKFQYDVWGDTVNTASRMESHGVAGKIQISEATWKLVGDEFVCTPRGMIDVKGKGVMKTWFLEGHVGAA